MVNRIMILGILITCFVSQGRSTLLSFNDESFMEVTKDGQPFLHINEAKDILAVWGTWSSSTGIFSPVYNSWADFPGELYYYNFPDQAMYMQGIYTSYSQIHPTSDLAIPTGTLMSLGIYDLPWDSSFPLSNEAARVILTDPFWAAPTWIAAGGATEYFFTQRTQPVFGTFTYNGGNEKIGLTTPSIPEPSSLSLLLIGLAGVASRRLLKRRS